MESIKTVRRYFGWTGDCRALCLATDAFRALSSCSGFRIDAGLTSACS